MGLDFIKKAAPDFDKGMDRSRIELATPKVFTRQPNATPRAYSARLLGEDEPCSGEKVGISLRDSQVLVMRGLTAIAVLRSPPVLLLEALTASFGEAYGLVQEVQIFSRTLEVTVW